jgi:hypothetical protein
MDDPPLLMPAMSAQLLVLATWAVAALGLVGIGQLVRRLLAIGAEEPGDLLGSFWLGWAALVLSLQTWHVFLPIDWRALGAASVAAIVGLAIGGAAPWAGLLRGALRGAPALVVCALAAFWLSNHALAGARYGDSGAYFIPTVRWLRAYAIVPGLGNLHAHLAFNQPYFFWVALLDLGPFAGRSSHVANGLLILALLCQIALAAWRLARRATPARPADLFLLLMLPGVLPLGLSIFVTSAAPDIAVFLLGAVASAELVALSTQDERRRERHLRALVVLTLAAVTSKLTFAGFGAGLLVVAPVVWLWLERPGRVRAARELALLGIIVAAAIGPWIARNVVLTGCPFFPSMAIVLPVEWRVRTDIETWFRRAVNSGGVAVMLADPRWFVAQLVRWGWNAPEVLAPTVVGLVAVLLGGVRRLWRARHPRLRSSIAIVLPALASLVFCLVNNPVPRYAGPTFSVLAAAGIIFAFGDVLLAGGAALRSLLFAAVLAATVLAARAGFDPLWLPLTGFEHNAPVRYEARQLETGLTVYVPTVSQACWDAPLPCTPFLNPALRLRREGDLQSGFVVDPELHERYRYDPGAPFVPKGQAAGS